MHQLNSAVNWLSTHPVLTGLATLLGTVLSLVASLRSEDAWIRNTAIAISLILGLAFLYIVRQYIWSAARWLTWKFGLGFLLGILLILILDPLLKVSIYSVFQDKSVLAIEIVHTIPKSDSSLESAYQGIEIYFSSDIQEWQRKTIDIEIEPDYPVEKIWIVDTRTGMPVPTNQLNIYPNKYFPGETRKRFEYNTNYSLLISGSTLQKTQEIQFQTPPAPGSS